MIFVKKIIDYIDQNITDYSDYVYVNIDYMHRAIKSIQIKDDKIIIESNFTSGDKFISAEQILDQLHNIRNSKLPIWLKVSIHRSMFKPLNFINVKKNKVNLYFDFDPSIDIDPIINDKNNDTDIDDEIDINEDEIKNGSDEFD